MPFISSLGNWLRKISKSFMGATISGKTITLTRHNGDTVTLTTQDTTYSDATQSASGLMSVNDKKKLDGIATGAEVNQNAFSNVKVGSTTVSADGKTDTLELEAGTGITLTPDATNDKITIKVTNDTYAAASHTHPYIPTAGGDITGAITQTNRNTPTLKFTNTTGRVTIGGGTAYNTGAYIWLYGKDNTSEPGCFDIDANNGTTYSRLHGTPDGALTWKGESILNQNAFSNVKVGSTTVAADAKTDTLELVAGTGITLTPDAANDKITIKVTDDTYAAASHTHSYLPLSGGTLTGALTFANNTWNTVGDDVKIGDFNRAGTLGIMGANGTTAIALCNRNDVTDYKTISYNGTTLSLGGYTLLKSVPADAVFTDHIYTAASDVPQPVTAVGAVGTSDKYAREDHIHARRCAFVGQSGASTTNPWFKFATFTINANWIGNETTFMVTGPYLDRYGILVVRFSSNGSAKYLSSTIKWLVTHQIFPENFVFVVGNDNKTLELWAKCASSYERYTFTVLSETSRGGPQALWTLLTSVSAGEAASPTAGTQVVSTLEGASGKLGTNNVGSITQPIYLAAGIPAACSVDGVVAQSIDTNATGGHSSYIKFNSGVVFIWGAAAFTTTTGTYIDVLKKIPCTTISAFATDSETNPSTAAPSSLHQINWARADSTNTTERFVTNTVNTGYFNYLIIGKA